MKKLWSKYREESVLFIISFLLLQFVGTSGCDLSGDAMQYVNMDGVLPPLYPVFLMLLRSIFGNNLYLSITVVIQSILASASIVCILHFLKKEYHLSWLGLTSFMFVLLAPWVRDGMREAPRYMGSHLILTEAIAIPLFYAYVWSAMVTLKKKNISSFLLMNVISALIMMARAQFKVCVPLNLCVLVYLLFVQEKRRGTFAIKGVILILAAYLITGAAEDAYTTARTGTTENAWNSSYFLLHVMYASDEEDVSEYQDANLQELYTQLYHQLDEEQYNYKYLQGSLYNKSWHWSKNFSKYYRDLKETVTEYVKEQGITEQVALDEKIAEYVDGLLQPLMLKHGLKSFGLSLYQLPISMCSNVFLLKENHLWISYIGTILIYVFTVIVSVKRFLQKKDSFAVWMMVFIMFFMIGNSVVVGYVLHTQSRYLMYSMGIFYVTLGLICVELWRNRREKTINEKTA